jgi:hypothetical protein
MESGKATASDTYSQEGFEVDFNIFAKRAEESPTKDTSNGEDLDHHLNIPLKEIDEALAQDYSEAEEFEEHWECTTVQANEGLAPDETEDAHTNSNSGKIFDGHLHISAAETKEAFTDNTTCNQKINADLSEGESVEELRRTLTQGCRNRTEEVC